MIDDLAKAAVRYVDLRNQIKALDDAKKEVQREFDEVRNQLLPTLLEDAGMDSARVTGVGTVALYDMLNIQIYDKDTGYGWLREHDHGDIIVDYIHPSTLKGWAKEMLKKGEEIPEDVFNLNTFTQARVTKR